MGAERARADAALAATMRACELQLEHTLLAAAGLDSLPASTPASDTEAGRPPTASACGESVARSIMDITKIQSVPHTRAHLRLLLLVALA